MSDTVLTIQVANRAGNRRLSRIIVAWVVFSFVGSLIVCCDLLASIEIPSATPAHSVAGPDIGHGHDRQHSHGDNKTSHTPQDDGKDCTANNIPDLAGSEYIVPQFPDPNKLYSGTDAVNFLVSSVQPVYFPLSRFPLPPVSTPRYLLFHRLLIDY